MLYEVALKKGSLILPNIKKTIGDDWMKNRVCFLVLLAVIVMAVSAQASVIYVRSDGYDGNDGSDWDLAKGTIGAALGIASSGDEVWVKAGTYSGSISIPDGVKLLGGFTGDESTRIWTVYVSTINSGSITATATSGSSAIDGFVLTGLSGITLTGDVTFCHNTVHDCNNISPVISCTGDVKLVSNLIYENTGYVTNHVGTVTIACAASGSDNATIVNNTIADNGYTDGDDGAGIYFTGTPTIANNIIASQQGNSLWNGSGSSPVVAHNCVYSTPCTLYYLFPEEWEPDDDINVDPVFYNPTNDNYTLHWTSPCYDAGDDSFIDEYSGIPDYARGLDLLGNSRILYTVDMGAYESGD